MNVHIYNSVTLAAHGEAQLPVLLYLTRIICYLEGEMLQDKRYRN